MYSSMITRSSSYIQCTVRRVRWNLFILLHHWSYVWVWHWIVTSYLDQRVNLIRCWSAGTGSGGRVRVSNNIEWGVRSTYSVHTVKIGACTELTRGVGTTFSLVHIRRDTRWLLLTVMVLFLCIVHTYYGVLYRWLVLPHISFGNPILVLLSDSGKLLVTSYGLIHW